MSSMAVQLPCSQPVLPAVRMQCQHSTPTGLQSCNKGIGWSNPQRLSVRHRLPNRQCMHCPYSRHQPMPKVLRTQHNHKCTRSSCKWIAPRSCPILPNLLLRKHSGILHASSRAVQQPPCSAQALLPADMQQQKCKCRQHNTHSTRYHRGLQGSVAHRHRGTSLQWKVCPCIKYSTMPKLLHTHHNRVYHTCSYS